MRRFATLLADAARFGRHRVGDRWHVEETYVRVAGRWVYLHRAVDQFGQVIDVYASSRRDSDAARRFFQHARKSTGVVPVEVITDRAPIYPAVVDELWPAAWHHGVCCIKRSEAISTGNLTGGTLSGCLPAGG